MMTDDEQWAAYHEFLGRKDGQIDGYFVGGFWGFLIGFASALLYFRMSLP